MDGCVLMLKIWPVHICRYSYLWAWQTDLCLPLLFTGNYLFLNLSIQPPASKLFSPHRLLCPLLCAFGTRSTKAKCSACGLFTIKAIQANNNPKILKGHIVLFSLGHRQLDLHQNQGWRSHKEPLLLAVCNCTHSHISRCWLPRGVSLICL